MMYVTLTFWLCAAGTSTVTDPVCDRVSLPWYGSFAACQTHGQAEIADWLRKAGREGERVRRWRCTAEPVPGAEKLARATAPIAR
ncbi:MAG: hypothetical protein K6T74_08855 [Geminicoccaceae bacterium]|nr:hypothetical protein [Geminicoccaceae bacterium]